MTLTRWERPLVRRLIPLSLLVLATAGLVAARENLDKVHVVLVYLVVVLAGSAVGGRAAGLLLAVGSFLAFNFFLLPPYNTLRIDDPRDWLVLLAFLVTIAGLIWWGGGQILAGTLTFGLLVAFMEYTHRFFLPIRDVSAKYTVMQSAMVAAERIFGLLDTPAEITAPAQPSSSLEKMPRPSAAQTAPASWPTPPTTTTMKESTM